MGAGSLAAVLALLAVLDVGWAVLFFKLPPHRLPVRHVGSSRHNTDNGRWNKVLFFFRVVAMVHSWSITILALLGNPGFDLCFFTVWSWMLLTVYFTFATVASHRHLKIENSADAGGMWSGEGAFPRFCQVLMATTSASALMLDYVLWSILYPADPDPDKVQELNFFSYNMHAANLVIVVLELWANSIHIRWQDVAIALAWPLFYTHFTLCRVALTPGLAPCLLDHINGTCDTEAPPDGKVVWPYFFMDTSEPFAILWYIVLLLLFMCAYAIVSRLARCRTLVLDAPLL